MNEPFQVKSLKMARFAKKNLWRILFDLYLKMTMDKLESVSGNIARKTPWKMFVFPRLYGYEMEWLNIF